MINSMMLATLCYVKDNGKTLMVHRNKEPNDIHQGKWNGLGRKFEAGEVPEMSAALREKLLCDLPRIFRRTQLHRLER
jgi:hypothetical protein